jgi:hypothetical protein
VLGAVGDVALVVTLRYFVTVGKSGAMLLIGVEVFSDENVFDAVGDVGDLCAEGSGLEVELAVGMSNFFRTGCGLVL